MEITLEIKGLDSLAESIAFLASAIGHHNGMENTVKAIAAMNGSQQVPGQVEMSEPVEPVQTTPEVEQAPATPSAPVVPTVPTTERTYTQDEISKAGVSLMDKGKQNELIALLNEFNVQSVPNLDKSQYGAFAMRLRELGADI